MPDVRELDAELLKFEAESREIVPSERLGAWLVGIRVGARARDLRQPPEARLRETHPVVTLDRSDVSANPARTPRFGAGEIVDLGVQPDVLTAAAAEWTNELKALPARR